MKDSIVIALISLLGGGGFTYLFTIRATRKKVTAEANKTQEEANRTRSEVKTSELDQVQEAIKIWREMAEDMKAERDEYKTAFIQVSDHNTKMAEQMESIRKELAKLSAINNKMVKLLDKITPDNLTEMVDKIKKCHEAE